MVLYDVLLLANVLLFAAFTLWYLRHPTASALHPATYFLLFYGFVFTLRPVYAWIYDFQAIYKVYEFDPSMDDKTTAILAGMLGFAVFMIVIMAVTRIPIDDRRDPMDRQERARLLLPLAFTAAALAPIGIWSSLEAWLGRSSDTTSMVLTDNGVFVNTTSNGYFATIPLALAALSLLIVYLGRFRLWSFIPFLGFIILRAGEGGRGAFVFAAVCAGLAWLYDKRWNWPPPRLMIIAGVIVLLFVNVGADRGQAIRGLFLENQIERDSGVRPAHILDGMDFGNLEYLEYVIYAVPQRTGTYDYFLENLQVFTEPVPRKLWSGKPFGAPIRLFELFDYGYPIGMTRSLFGVGWMALGYLGVAIQCALFALMFGKAHQWFARSRRTPVQVSIYMVVLGMTLIGFRDGTLLTMAKQSLFYFMPIVLLVLFDRLLMRRNGAPVGNAIVEARPQGMTPAERRRQLAAMD